MERIPDAARSPFSQEVAKEYPGVMDRIQGELNLVGGAFRPVLHQIILHAMQSFDIRRATSEILDAPLTYDHYSTKQQIARHFADYLEDLADPYFKNESGRDDARLKSELNLVEGLLRGVRSIT